MTNEGVNSKDWLSQPAGCGQQLRDLRSTEPHPFYSSRAAEDLGPTGGTWLGSSAYRLNDLTDPACPAALRHVSQSKLNY